MKIHIVKSNPLKYFVVLLALLCLGLTKSYGQDEVREDLINADDYSHYLENISDSVQYLKDTWNSELIRINDTDHDAAKIKKNTNALLKFLKDKKHDVKNLGSIGNGGDALKSAYVSYLNSEIDAVTKYYVPFGETAAQAEASFNKLSGALKEENEQEKGFAETLDAAKDAYNNENKLDGESGDEQ